MANIPNPTWEMNMNYGVFRVSGRVIKTSRGLGSPVQKVEEKKAGVWLGEVLCDCPQEMLFYVKRTPVFKAVMFILACFQFILSCVFTEHLGRQPGFILGKNNFEVHRVCSPSPKPLISPPTPKELCSLCCQGKVRAHSKLYMSGKDLQGALGIERNQLSCLSKSFPKSTAA